MLCPPSSKKVDRAVLDAAGFPVQILRAGTVNTYAIKPGQHLTLKPVNQRLPKLATAEDGMAERQEGTCQPAAQQEGVIALKSSTDLRLVYSDATEWQVVNFFNDCKSADQCSVSVSVRADDASDAYRLSAGSRPGPEVGSGNFVLYAQGESQQLGEMVVQLGGAKDALHMSGPAGSLNTYIPKGELSMGWVAAGLGVMVLGGGGGGHGGSAGGNGGGNGGASLKAAPTVSAPLEGVSALDVQSDIVLNFSDAIQLTQSSSSHLRIVHDGGVGFHADDAWRSEVGSGARDILISADSNLLHLSSDKKTLVIDPGVHLDFGSRYHIDIEAGFYMADGNASQVNVAMAAVSGGTFGTVAPLSGADQNPATAISSVALNAVGILQESYKYWDIQGVGQLTLAKGPFDLSTGKYALTYKDYDSNSVDLANSLGYSGIGVGDTAFNLQVIHFGLDDLIYFDDQYGHGANANVPDRLRLSKGLALNLLPGQSSDDLVLDGFLGTMQIDPAYKPGLPAPDPALTNNGAGYLGIASVTTEMASKLLDSSFINQAVIAA